jgi:hypothetical protein
VQKILIVPLGFETLGMDANTHAMRNEMHTQTKWLSAVFRAVVLSMSKEEFHPVASKQAL